MVGGRSVSKTGEESSLRYCSGRTCRKNTMKVSCINGTIVLLTSLRKVYSIRDIKPPR